MKQFSAHPRRRGFTLVEVLISLAIMAVIMVAIGVSLKNAAQSARVNALTAETRQQAMNGLNYVLSSIRQAKWIYLYDAAGNEVVDSNVHTGPKLRVVKVMDPTNGADVKWSTIDLDTSDGHSYLRVTSEAGTSDPALDSVTSLNFTAPAEIDGTRRMITVNMTVRIADPMAPNDLTKAKFLNLEATEVARCVNKP